MIKLNKFLIPFIFLSISQNGFVQKPILPDFHADPSAHVWDNKIWIYPSTDEPGSTSWEQMKKWHCYSSTDLEHWKNEGEIFSLEKVSWADKAAYAPDCMKWKGNYYFFFPADYNLGVAVSEKPTGPFKDALGEPLVKNKEAGITAFDPCIFIDDDSTPYLYYGGHGTVGVVELSDDLITRKSDIVKLDLQNYNEGIWVHKIKETYYFSYPIQIDRDGKIKQLLAYSTAQSPYGPFTYHGTFFDNNSRNSHHSIIKILDKWYLFYHIEGPSPFERRVCVEYLEYDQHDLIKEVKMTDSGVNTINIIDTIQ